MTTLLVIAALVHWLSGSVPGSAAQEPPKPVRVVIETEAGEIEAEIDTVRAPITAANFLKYVDAGLFDGGRFFASSAPTTRWTNPSRSRSSRPLAAASAEASFFRPSRWSGRA